MSTAVIFDMDGTLFDTEAVFQKHYRVKDGTEIQRECKQRVAKELACGVP